MSQYFLSNEPEDESLTSLTVKTDLNEFEYSAYASMLIFVAVPQRVVRYRDTNFSINRAVAESLQFFATISLPLPT